MILGGGVAAVSAARAIQARNETASVRIISEEKHVPYCRPMLSKGHLESFMMSGYSIADSEWFRENRISLELGRTVTALDTAGKTVTLENGETVAYDKCIYALGSRSFVPPIAGREKGGVFTLRSDADLLGIHRQMLTAKHAAVIGGGITGLEIAWEMKAAGLSVTVLDMAPVLMGRLLDMRSSEVWGTRIEEAGVSVLTGVTIRSLEGENSVEAVALEDGRSIPAEQVILSTGFQANLSVAQEAGLTVGKAVEVDEHMQTSCPGVYACGDCTDRSLSTWMQSVQQGETAGANAAGDDLVFRAPAEPAMVHTAGTSLLSIGDMGKEAGRDYRLVYGTRKAASGRYFVNPKPVHRTDTFYAISFSEGKTTGMTLLGDLSDMLFAQDAVQQQWDEQTLMETAAKRGIEFYAE